MQSEEMRESLIHRGRTILGSTFGISTKGGPFVFFGTVDEYYRLGVWASASVQ